MSPDFFQPGADKLTLNFIAENREQHEKFLEREGRLSDCDARDSLLASRVETMKQKVELFEMQFSAISDVDFPRSIWATFERNVKSINVIAAELVEVAFLNQHGAAALKIAHADLVAAERELKSFRAANADDLKMLAERQAAAIKRRDAEREIFQAEQATAAERDRANLVPV